MTYYMVNGFDEHKEYFYRIGLFNERQREALDRGEVVEKNGDRFWITDDEFGRPQKRGDKNDR